MTGSLAQASKGAFSTASVTSLGVTFGSNTTTGNAIYCVIQDGATGSGNPTAADNVNGSYGTQLDTINDTANGNTVRHWVKANITGGATTVTGSFGASHNFVGIFAAEATGITTTPVDAHSVATAQSVANGGTISAGTMTTTGTDFLLGFAAGANTGNPGIAAGSGFTADLATWNQGAGNSALSEYKASVASGTPACTWANGLGGTFQFNSLGVALKESGGGAPTVHPYMMMGMGT